jgi:hypothetical protein
VTREERLAEIFAKIAHRIIKEEMALTDKNQPTKNNVNTVTLINNECVYQ